MRLSVAYGKSGLEMELDDDLDVTVKVPTPVKGLDDVRGAVRHGLDAPIGTPSLPRLVNEKASEVAKSPGELKACIVVSDHTRPVPNHAILPPLLDALGEAGIGNDNITILVATGLHRGSTSEEIDQNIGKDVRRNYRVVNHDARDRGNLVDLGTSSLGTPILVNKEYCSSDLKILTGYVDPHFFAGYAGGRKSIVPGIAGAATIIENHSGRNIGHPRARFLSLEGNPIHDDALEIAKKVGVDMILNVCLNEKHEVTRVAAGDLEAAHADLVSFMEEHVVADFDEPFDIVVVNNGGYPLDLNLYQSVKSMAIGEMAVKKGGTIIATNELSDGFGAAEFKEIIERETDPGGLLERIISRQLVIEAQWQVQVLARVLMKARVVVVSSMRVEDFRNVKIGMEFSPAIDQALAGALGRHGRDARILVLPAGPQVIPRVRGD